MLVVLATLRLVYTVVWLHTAYRLDQSESGIVTGIMITNEIHSLHYFSDLEHNKIGASIQMTSVA